MAKSGGFSHTNKEKSQKVMVDESHQSCKNQSSEGKLRAAGKGLSMVKLRLHAMGVAREMDLNDGAGKPGLQNYYSG